MTKFNLKVHSLANECRKLDRNVQNMSDEDELKEYSGNFEYGNEKGNVTSIGYSLFLFELPNKKHRIFFKLFDDDQYRIDRLSNMINILYNLEFMWSGCDYKKLLSKIDTLEDSKGTLTITWSEKPYDYEKDKIEKAWDLLSHEECCFHYVITYLKD